MSDSQADVMAAVTSGAALEQNTYPNALCVDEKKPMVVPSQASVVCRLSTARLLSPAGHQAEAD